MSTTEMEHHPEDTKGRRFTTFWIVLALFLVFAVVVWIFSSAIDAEERFTMLDGGEVAERRLATLNEVAEAQQEAFNAIDLKGAVEAVRSRPAAAKSSIVIPGTPAAQKLFEQQQAQQPAETPAAPEDGSQPAEPEPSGPARKITIKAVPNILQYDIKAFEVKAGQPVELTLENPDLLQHNLLILAQGSRDKVGAAADALMADPQGLAKSYIPDMPEVLHHTALVNPNQAETLKFTAPSEPGEYPYICTFPGHWRLMNGVMTVVP